MSNKKNVAFYIFFIVAIALAITIYFIPFNIFNNENYDKFLKDIFIRLIVIAILVMVAFLFGLKNQLYFKSPRKKDLPMIISAFFVAMVNFPLHAIIVGTAKITDIYACFLLATDCIVVAMTEELFFREILYESIKERTVEKKNAVFFRVIISAVAFSLFHLLNLLGGASIGATMLQVAYTFLLGCLFATLKEVTTSIWYGAIVHAIFNFGGNVVTFAGSGQFQDNVFWIATITMGLVAGVTTLFTLVRENKSAN